MGNKILFLDRDGTINVEKGYINNLKDLELIPKAAEALQKAKSSGYLLSMITNQAGIGKGLTPPYMPQNVAEEIEVRVGLKFDDIRICPHTEESRCACRKPGTKNLELSMEKLNGDLEQCFFIGDMIRDVEIAHRMKMKCILVLTGHGPKTLEDLKTKTQFKPYFIAADLFEAVEHILKNFP